MKFWAIKRGMHLEPHGTESIEEFDRLPTHKPLQIDVTQPRNLEHHRLFWALCARIGKGIGKDAEWVERAFKVETGHFDVYTYAGKESMVLRSISFAKMDQIAFREFFEACVQVAYRVWRIDPASVADLLVPQEVQKRR